MKTGYAYARYSSDNQRQESVDAQLQAIRDYASKEGIAIIKEYVDREQSATNDDREQFQVMIEEAKKDKPGCIVVHKLDRFARNRYDSAIYGKRLKDHGTQVLSVLERFDDTPESIILRSVLEGMAEYYSANLSREVMKGLMQNAQKGVWNGGRPPYGYKLDQNRRVVLDDEAAPAIRKVFSMYKDGYGLSAIAMEMNASGYRSSLGKSWRKNTIHDTLKNERYTGTYVYNQRSKTAPDGRRNNHFFKPDSEIIKIPDCFPAIIDRDVWDATQKRLAARATGPRAREQKRMYLLTGLVWCGICKSPYVGYGYRKKDMYPIYSCTKKSTGACENSSINADYLEDECISHLKHGILSPAAINRLAPAIVTAAAAKNESVADEIAAIQKQIKNEEAKISNLLDMIENGTGSKEQLNRRLNDRETTLKNYVAQQESLRNSGGIKVSEEQVRTYLNACRNALNQHDFVAKRKIVETFVKRIDVFRDRCTYVYQTDQVVGSTGGTKVGQTLTTTSERRQFRSMSRLRP